MSAANGSADGAHRRQSTGNGNGNGAGADVRVPVSRDGTADSMASSRASTLDSLDEREGHPSAGGSGSAGAAGKGAGAGAGERDPDSTILTQYQIDQMYDKIQLKIVPFLMFLYFLAFLDRANVGNAHDALREDLGMSESQYTIAAAIFFLGYTVAEVPANLAMTKVQPALWISLLMLIWGALAAAMSGVKNYTQLLIVRTFLGLFEGGFFPGAVFYLTSWFPPDRIARPIALFHSASAIAGCIGGLLAYGILQMDGVNGWEGWRWLFLLEGLPTIVVGATVYFVLPARPDECAWLDADEKLYLRNQLTKQSKDVHSYDLSWPEVRDTLISPKILTLCVISFFMLIPVYSTAFYMPTLIASFGWGTFTSNALTAPVYAVAIASSLLNSWHSDKTKERYWHVLVPVFASAVAFSLLCVAIRMKIQAFEFTMLFFTTGCTWASVGPFFGWLSGLLKSRTAAAVGIAWVGALSHPAAFVGPKMYAMGKESAEHSFWPAMVGVALAAVVAGAIILGWVFSCWNEPVAFHEKAKKGAAAHEHPAPGSGEDAGLLGNRNGRSDSSQPDSRRP